MPSNSQVVKKKHYSILLLEWACIQYIFKYIVKLRILVFIHQMEPSNLDLQKVPQCSMICNSDVEDFTKYFTGSLVHILLSIVNFTLQQIK